MTALINGIITPTNNAFATAVNVGVELISSPSVFLKE